MIDSSATDTRRVLPYCDYCFARLDPQSARSEFVRCTQCEAIYHRDCWQHNSYQCARCEQADAYPIEVASSALAPPMRYRYAQPLRPKRVIYLIGSRSYEVPRFVREEVAPFYQTWQPRVAETLRRWTLILQAYLQGWLNELADYLLAEARSPKLGRSLKLNQVFIARILVYGAYLIIFYLGWRFLRWIF